MGMPNETSTATWLKGAAWVLGLVAPLLIGGLAAYTASVVSGVQREHDDLQQRVVVLEGLVSGLVQSTAKTLQHVELHTAEKNHWILRIEENSRAITSLTKDTHARPDPYTGTDGRRDKAEVMGRLDKLRDDVRINERRLNACEVCCERCKTLHEQNEKQPRQ